LDEDHGSGTPPPTIASSSSQNDEAPTVPKRKRVKLISNDDEETTTDVVTEPTTTTIIDTSNDIVESQQQQSATPTDDANHIIPEQSVSTNNTEPEIELPPLTLTDSDIRVGVYLEEFDCLTGFRSLTQYRKMVSEVSPILQHKPKRIGWLVNQDQQLFFWKDVSSKIDSAVLTEIAVFPNGLTVPNLEAITTRPNHWATDNDDYIDSTIQFGIAKDQTHVVYPKESLPAFHELLHNSKLVLRSIHTTCFRYPIHDTTLLTSNDRFNVVQHNPIVTRVILTSVSELCIFIYERIMAYVMDMNDDDDLPLKRKQKPASELTQKYIESEYHQLNDIELKIEYSNDVYFAIQSITVSKVTFDDDENTIRNILYSVHVKNNRMVNTFDNLLFRNKQKHLLFESFRNFYQSFVPIELESYFETHAETKERVEFLSSLVN